MAVAAAESDARRNTGIIIRPTETNHPRQETDTGWRRSLRDDINLHASETTSPQVGRFVQDGFFLDAPRNELFVCSSFAVHDD